MLFYLFPAIVFLYVLFKLIEFLVNSIRMTTQVLKFSGPPSSYNFLKGNCQDFFGSAEEVFKTNRLYAKLYYPYYGLWLANRFSLNLLAPEDFEIILTNNKHNTKSVIYSNLETWLRKGLLTSSGQKWLNRRKILTPAFHFTILQEFIITFNEETEDLVKLLKGQTGRSIDIAHFISMYTLKTIGQTSMGTEINGNNGGTEYRKAVEEISDVFLYKLLRPWCINKLVFFILYFKKYLEEKRYINILQGFTKKVIKDRENTFTNENIKHKRLAMLDLLLENKRNENGIDDEGIHEEVDTFMFEGHDTTSVVLSFCLMLIACHKNVQDTLYEEIVNTLGDEKPTFQSLQDLKYMEMVLKESLRLYPSVIFISRDLGEDMITHKGDRVLKGSIVSLHIYDLHHNPDIYPDPEKFDPDRFLPENIQNRHRFAYLPFSAGARNCIGQRFALLEMKALLCGLLRNFILEPIDTPETITLLSHLVLRPKNGVRVKLLPRN